MPKICKCSSGPANTGAPNCSEAFKVALRYIAVPTYDSTGALNCIAETDVIDEAYLTAKLNAPNKLDRWYPLPLMENVVDERADAITQEFDSGNIYYIRDGARTVTTFYPNIEEAYVKKLNGIGCSDISIYIVDQSGAIQGNSKTAGKLLPIRVNKNTWSARAVKSSYTSVGGADLNFQYDLTEDDGDLQQILASDMTADLAVANGLLDVFGKGDGTATTVELTVTLETCFGSFLSPDKVSGCVVGDFTVYNETTASAVTPSAAVETDGTDGTYVLTYPAQTAADVLHVRLAKNGFDDAELRLTTFVVA